MRGLESKDPVLSGQRNVIYLWAKGQRVMKRDVGIMIHNPTRWASKTTQKGIKKAQFTHFIGGHLASFGHLYPFIGVI